MSVECYVVVHNIAKRHNVGTLARSATAFGVSELILVGRRDFNAFGSHGSTSHVSFRHFHSLSDARQFLKVREFCGFFFTKSLSFWLFWVWNVKSWSGYLCFRTKIVIFVGSRLQTLLWLSISTLSRKAPLFYSEMRYGVLNFLMVCISLLWLSLICWLFKILGYFSISLSGVSWWNFLLSMEVWICMLYHFSFRCAKLIILLSNHRLKRNITTCACKLQSKH